MPRRRATRAAKGGAKARRRAAERPMHEKAAREVNICRYAAQYAAEGFVTFPGRRAGED